MKIIQIIFLAFFGPRLVRTTNRTELLQIFEDVLDADILKDVKYVNLLATDEYFKDLKTGDFVMEVIKSVSRHKAVMSVGDSSIRKLANRKVLLSLMFLRSIEDFEKIMKNFSDTRFSYRGFYIIYFENVSSQNVQSIFNVMWSMFIHNVNLIHQVNKSIHVTTFLPFRPNKCNSTEPVTIAKYENGHVTYKPDNFFPQKFQNFHNCSLSLVTFATLAPSVLKRTLRNGSTELYGRDIEVMDMLKTELNFHPNLTYLHEYGSWGVLYSNGTTTGAMGRAARGESQIAWGNLNLKIDRALIMDFSFGYYLDTLIFVIPQGEPYSAFIKLLRPFASPVWIALLIVILICIVIIVLLSFVPKNVRHFVYGKNVKYPLMNVLIAMYGGTQHQLPTLTFARYLLMMFLLFCLVLRSLYQGSLFQFLQANDNKPPVSSIEEMSKNDFSFNIIPSYDDMTRDNVAMKGKRVIIQPAEIKDILESTLDVTYKGTLLVAISEILYKNKLKAENRTKLYTICKEPFTMIPISLYYPMNSYLRDPFDEKLVWYQCSGLMEFWASHEVDYKYMSTALEKGPKSMTIEHLSGTFEIWILANILATLVFFSEVLRKFCRKKTRKNTAMKDSKKNRPCL